MNLGLFNCRLIQAAGDQLFFFVTRFPYATPSLRFLLSRICWKVGAESRARGFCAAKQTLDSVPSFHRMSLESEGKTTLKSCAAHHGFSQRPRLHQRRSLSRPSEVRLQSGSSGPLFTLTRIERTSWHQCAPRTQSRFTHKFCYRARKRSPAGRRLRLLILTVSRI